MSSGIRFFTRSSGKPPVEWDDFFGPPIVKGSLPPGASQQWKQDVGKNIGALRANAHRPTSTGEGVPTPPNATAFNNNSIPNRGHNSSSSTARSLAANPNEPISSGSSLKGDNSRSRNERRQQSFVGVILEGGGGDSAASAGPPIPCAVPENLEPSCTQGVLVTLDNGQYGKIVFVTNAPPPQPCNRRVVGLAPPQGLQRGKQSEQTTGQGIQQVGGGGTAAAGKQVMMLFAGVQINGVGAPIPCVLPEALASTARQGAQVKLDGGDTGIITFITDQKPPTPCRRTILSITGSHSSNSGGAHGDNQQPHGGTTFYAGIRFQDGSMVPYIAPFAVSQNSSVEVEGGKIGVVAFVTAETPPQAPKGRIVRLATPSATVSASPTKNEPIAKTGTTGAAAAGRSPPAPPSRQNSGVASDNAKANVRSVTPPVRSPAAKDDSNASEIPEGYTKTDDPEYYFSEESNLYYHVPSEHFYDADSDFWYNPETEEWYQVDDE